MTVTWLSITSVRMFVYLCGCESQSPLSQKADILDSFVTASFFLKCCFLIYQAVWSINNIIGYYSNQIINPTEPWQSVDESNLCLSTIKKSVHVDGGVASIIEDSFREISLLPQKKQIKQVRKYYLKIM